MHGATVWPTIAVLADGASRPRDHGMVNPICVLTMVVVISRGYGGGQLPYESSGDTLGSHLGFCRGAPLKQLHIPPPKTVSTKIT